MLKLKIFSLPAISLICFSTFHGNNLVEEKEICHACDSSIYWLWLVFDPVIPFLSRASVTVMSNALNLGIKKCPEWYMPDIVRVCACVCVCGSGRVTNLCHDDGSADWVLLFCCDMSSPVLQPRNHPVSLSLPRKTEAWWDSSCSYT